jgi:serine protease AprX
VKELLLDNARTLTGESSQCQGAGELNLRSALRATTPRSRQSFTPSTGTGSLEAARGTDHLTNNGVVLSGEIDIFGNPVDTAKLAELAAEGAAWVGTSWNDSSWAGLSWSGVSWSGVSWSGLSWSGTSWSGMTWTGVSWSGTSWSGTSWSGTSWSDSAWLGQSWG